MTRLMRRLLCACALLAVCLCCSAAFAENMGQVTADGVKMRENPGTDTAVLIELDLGDQVDVLAYESGWYRVMLSGVVGYIRQDYVFVPSEGSRGGYVLDDEAVMRGGPSEDTYQICVLSAGQGVKIKSVVGEWYFVVANDQAGYVQRSHLSLTAASTASGSMLKTGMEGEAVEKLQKQLYQRGFLQKSDMTGIYNSATRKAVLEYQRAAGLSGADGVAGTETLGSIFDSNNKVKKENAEFSQLKGTVIQMDWFEGGSDWLAKGAKFTVTDVRTKLSFRARRFGGWYHADSEPITAADTAVMKRIAGGSWSWNRRPIWVTYRGRTVAASMHCMPHMANPTKSNGFDGHFCIHLLNSKVHETSKPCPRHQSCVREAYRAGRA